MTHVLVTFLGAPDSGRPPSLRKRKGYQEVIYGFRGSSGQSDTKHYPQRFFPLALRDYLDESGKPVDKLVVFGTPGSAWDEFLLYVGIPSLRLADIDALRREIERNAVEGARLQAEWADRVKGALRLPKGVLLKVIKGYAEETGEQVEMIARLAETAEQATEVTFDVTHGLRYLPLLGSLAAYVVNSKGKVPVNVWYGAYDMRKANSLGEEVAPAIELGGLSRIVDWLAAFKNFEWDGDYWAFAEALEHEDKATATALAEAAFLDRLGRIEEADNKFREVRDGIAGAAGSTVIGLFRSALEDRFAVLDLTSDQLFHHQRALALHHLAHEDVVHAAIWGREAAVTRIVPAMRPEFELSVVKMPESNSKERKKKKRFQAYVNVTNVDKFVRIREVRQKCADLYGNRSMAGVAEHISSQHKKFLRIRCIRNAFAHGVSEMEDDNQPADGDGLPELQSFDACKAALAKSLNSFLDEKDPKGANLFTSSR